VDAVLAELATFPERYPAMRNWVLGRNVSTRDTTMTHAFTVDFESVADLRAYLDSPSHEEFVRERWKPVVEQRYIVSIPVPERNEQ
jgi:hypothetical protein